MRPPSHRARRTILTDRHQASSRRSVVLTLPPRPDLGRRAAPPPVPARAGSEVSRMNRPSPRLQVEELEGRTLLAAPALPTPVFATSLAAPVSPLSRAPHLGGTIYGRYTAERPILDVGTTYRLEGPGQAGSFGLVTVFGSVHTTGFIAFGHAGGKLTLTNAQGSVTLRLEGPRQPGFRPLPANFTFTVQQGTGAYKHFHAQGTVDLRLQSFVTPNSRPAFVQHGAFTLTIHQAPTPETARLRGTVLEGPIRPVDLPGVPN